MPTIKNAIIVTSLTITSVLTCFFAYQNYQISQNNKNNIKTFEEEKKILETQIEEILVSYDKVKSENAELKKEQQNFFENFSVTQTNLVKSQYSNDITPDGQIKNLKFQNQELELQKNEIEAQIENNTIKINELEEHNYAVVEKSVKQLKAKNVNARGVRVLSDLYKKTKVQPIQELRVCFTLEGTEFVGEGNKKIYIQIVNPNNRVVSVDKDVFSDKEGNQTIYSSKTDVAYNQKDTDVCVYVDLEKNKIIKGTYQVNLFYDTKKIGSTSYQYN